MVRGVEWRVEVDMETMTIGQVAKQAGVGIETVRFYEREALIAKPARSPSGYRQYAPEVVRRIRFIRHAKELGFTLREIKELLGLRVAPDGQRDQVRVLAKAKIEDIEQRIHKLQEIKRTLSTLVCDCEQGQASDPCPILAAMDREER